LLFAIVRHVGFEDGSAIASAEAAMAAEEWAAEEPAEE
jgi:hypothetical protein